MKKLCTTIATVGLLVLPAFGQGQIQIQSSIVGLDGAPVFDKEPFVWVEKIAGGNIWYRERKTNPKIAQAKLVDLKAVYLSRPADYVAAIELFENRKYESALTAFRDFKEKYKFFTDIDNSFPALAGYYELAYLADKAYPKVIKEYETNWLNKKLPSSLRAQVEFVYGKSLEAEGRSEDALIALCKAMNADFARLSFFNHYLILQHSLG